LSAAFEAAYAIDEPVPSLAATEETFTTAPFALFSALAQARAIWNGPTTLTR
jgi:hypothetical protein